MLAPDTPAPPAARRFASLVGLVARHWRRAVDQRLQPFDLTEAAWMPLVHLARAGQPMRQNALAALLSLDSSSVVRILANLEAAGLVERSEDEEDRRAKAIVITPRGRALARRVERVSAALEQALMAGLPPADIAAARRVLERLAAALAAHDGPR